MEQNQNKEDILVFEEKQSGKLAVVSGIDKNGSLQIAEPDEKNQTQFLTISNKGMLENFMSNFLKQYNDPVRFGLYKLVNEKVEESVETLKNMINNSKQRENGDALKACSVSFDQFTAGKDFRIDENRIDWNQFEAVGVTRERLEASGDLNAMLEWKKTPNLIPITVNVGETTIRTEARLSFREGDSGELNLNINVIRKQPELDRPFMGVRFSDEDKQNLLETGNLGRLVELNPNSNRPFNAYVSIDPLTNELIACGAERIRIPEKLMGVPLSEQQRTDLADGKSIYVEGMKSSRDKEFSATLQINADKKGIEFRFDNSQGFTERQSQTQSNNGVNISKVICQLELTDKQHQALTEGRTLYLKNMIDKEGQPFNAYVKYDNDENRLRFFKWNPDKVKEQTVAVAEESKVQVAVNNEGKTNEATKDIKEPLKKGQTNLTQQQQQKMEEKTEQKKKSRGVRM